MTQREKLAIIKGLFSTEIFHYDVYEYHTVYRVKFFGSVIRAYDVERFKGYKISARNYIEKEAKKWLAFIEENEDIKMEPYDTLGVKNKAKTYLYNKFYIKLFHTFEFLSLD